MEMAYRPQFFYVAILRKEAVVNEIFRGLTKFEVDTELVITYNALGHTESMAFLG